MLSFKYEVFLEVARQLSFSKASQNLYISQPAVSKHIKQLEAHYKTILIERKGNAITLTPVGKYLYEKLLVAKKFQQEADFVISQLSTTFKPSTVLRFGASTTVALYILPPVLSAYKKLNPSLEISLINRNSENIVNALLSHEIDLGITEGLGKINTIVYKRFITDEVVAVCSQKNKLYNKRSSLQAKDLVSMPIALRERGSGTLAVMKTALENKNIKIADLNVVIRLGGTEALKNFILADECIGFLPRRAVLKELKYKELAVLKIRDLKIMREFYFIQRKGEESGPVNSHFIRFASKFYNQ
jgi:DNA-binding transcriptional LysR family regulator